MTLDEQAEAFQKECNEVVTDTVKSLPALSNQADIRVMYQHMTNVWMFRKLAELQLQINELRGGLSVINDRTAHLA